MPLMMSRKKSGAGATKYYTDTQIVNNPNSNTCTFTFDMSNTDFDKVVGMYLVTLIEGYTDSHIIALLKEDGTYDETNVPYSGFTYSYTLDGNTLTVTLSYVYTMSMKLTTTVKVAGV